MKQVLALLAALAAAACLTACTAGTNGSSSGAAAGQSSAAQSSQQAADGIKTGLGSVISLKKSAGATAETGPAAQADVTMCAASFDSSGKIVSVQFDMAQCRVAFDKEGAVTTDLAAGVRTKRQIGDDYGMKAASGIQKEWYEQADALQHWMVGKTVEQVTGMKTVEKDEAHPKVPDEQDLKSSVTISVGDFLEALQDAYNNAR